MKVKVWRRKTAQEAWEDFKRHYMPKETDKLEQLLQSPAGQRAMAAAGIYLNARRLGYLPALNMARCACSEEERNFFAYIADMNLQREQQAYIRNEKYDPTIPVELTPSPAGRECLGNGMWPGYECQCDNCENYLECFPEYA